MSTILTVYSNMAFKRFLLPAINDADYSVLLFGGLFSLDRDLELKMEVIDHHWAFLSSEDYELRFQNGSFCYGALLSDGDIIKLSLDGKYVISIIVTITDQYFSVYSKYTLKDISRPLMIGSGSDNDILCSSDLIAPRHARISFNGKDAHFEDIGGTNGSFVNNRRVEGGIPLAFGDRIDIYELRIVFLGDIIAVNSNDAHITVNKKFLKPVTVSAEPLIKIHKNSLIKVFHRSPRHIAKITTETINIDEAPQPKELEQPSMFMTIAPTLTMALPMILGCALMIYSSSSSGAGSGLYLYTGLITSVSSALIGAIWAAVNLKSARRKSIADEARRNQKYGEYLHKKEEIIKEKYNRNTMAMLERYKPANECCSYTVNSIELWNRNATQTDFLNHRIGIGDVQFQAEIKIPNEKFSMIDDELVELPRKLKKNYGMLHNVPVCIDLLQERLIGVFGGRNMRGAVNVVLNFIAQIAANNSYTDVKLVVIYDEKKTGLSGTWDFAKWLPHVWNETNTVRYVASNREEASDVFYELTKKLRMIAENAGNAQEKDKKTYVAKPYYVIVLANPETLEGELISRYILDPQPLYGITTLYMTESYEDLPNECEFVIENSEEFQGVYRLTDDLEDRTPVIFDPVSPSLLEHLSENLAHIEVHEVASGGDVPNALTFFDMYGVQKLSELNVMERWKKNRTYDSMKALIGEKSGGIKCYLDVHEKYHGPHGLVAGTTGSGKSETLQTYILSLALNFSPDDIGFFIIDYKGGGMGNLFNELPHMIGQISNLSGNQIRRALVSIKSEKDRRQRIFNEYGVNNINSYTKLYKNNETKIPVPHMFIVIDEFAEMKRDEPDFIQELVSVSQVGRSLGIHLIMATQKPAGTVDDNIWSNSRFKLCLRVQDRQDSMDMLHRPDAAYIIQAGRCYLQVGNDELFELFQSGWSGAPYSEDPADLSTEVAKMLSVNGVPALEGSRAKLERKLQKRREWIARLVQTAVSGAEKLGISVQDVEVGTGIYETLVGEIFDRIAQQKIEYPCNEYNEKGLAVLLELIRQEGTDPEKIIAAAEMTNRKLPEQAEITQLDAVVGYLKDTARANGFTHDFSLFLPLLGDTIYLHALPQQTLPFNEQTAFDGRGWPKHSGEWTLAVSMGLYDDPENQRQDTYIIDLAKTGHIAICGTIATGKSTLLQTFLYGLLNRYTPNEVQAYIIDFSAKMLSAFEDAPHVGGVMYEDDTEKIAKFFTLIKRLLDARKKQLKGGSYEQYLAVNGLGSLPAVVIIIDNYSAFLAKGGITEETEDFMLQLSKEGVSYGIFLVVTAAGFGSGELPGKMAENFRTTISLEMNDFMIYTEIMRKMHLDVYPESDIKGRGIAYVGDRVLEFQTALAVEAESDYARSTAIRNLCEQMNAIWDGKKAKKIPEIPEKPLWSEYAQIDDVIEMFDTPNLLPMGYDAVFADIYGIDLSKIYTYTISGIKRKGKTNLLKLLALSTKSKNGRVVMIDYGAQLKKFAESFDIECITTEIDFYHFLASIQSDFEARNKKKHEFAEQGLEENEIFDAMQCFEKIYIFIDNLPQFIETAYALKGDTEVGEYVELLEVMVDFGTLHNVFWFSCLNKKEVGVADTYRLYELFTRDKKGIHLGGMTDDSVMNFDHLDYHIRDQVMAVGRGLLPVDNEEKVAEVVIPLVKGSGR